MNKKLMSIVAIVAAFPMLSSFCGFYVSKADGTLKNKTSQVILVRDGNKNVITMYNDFSGPVKDFAMVVPVPVVLARSDIRVIDHAVFQRLNDYSAPRLVEYYDQNPCERRMEEYESTLSAAPADMTKSKSAARKDAASGVTVEARYTVGEYDIILLSAKESTGLKAWLTGNGYKIPARAEEVMEPYIKSNLKFFVVKVNLKEKEKAGLENLRPIQIRFNSPKFMLPIRLGMANADSDQDMIIYALTRTGKVETTNYRTVALPTDKNIPLFVKNDFSDFYSKLFLHQWKKEDKAIAFIEYAWDVSPSNYVKCDPCVSAAPDYNDLKTAGVWWLGNTGNDYINGREARQSVYLTRLHVRYNRQSFPQDLSFQVTPDTENFQARYIITHPAKGAFDCTEGQDYVRNLKERRKKEMKMLSFLTGKDAADWDLASDSENDLTLPPDLDYSRLAQLSSAADKGSPAESGKLVLAAAVIGICLSAVSFRVNKT